MGTRHRGGKDPHRLIYVLPARSGASYCKGSPAGLNCRATKLHEPVMSERQHDRMQLPNRHRTPHQVLGPYFPVASASVSSGDLTVGDGREGRAQGEIIEVKGRVLNREGEPVRGARLTIWQANAFGRYAHPNDSNPLPLDANFVGFAAMVSDHNGSYRIKTVKPGAYPVGPGQMRPPHIHFEVQGNFERLITQMYFPGEPLNS